MTPKTLAELMKLSPSEREEFVTTDWENYVDDDGLDDELDEETIAELRRRSADSKANPGSDIPWSEFRRRLQALTGESDE